MDNGFIVLHRKILSWEWYDDANVMRLFIHFLLTANHEEKNWRGHQVKRGQLITGLHSLSEQTGLSVAKIRTTIKKLESTGEITIKTTNKFSLITVAAYDSYQNKPAKQQAKQQTNDKQITNKSQQTTIKQLNNSNKKKVPKKKPTGFVKPTLDQIQEYIQSKSYTVNPIRFFNHYESNGWKVGRNSMKCWKSAISNWQTREKTHENYSQQKQQPKIVDELQRAIISIGGDPV